MPAIETQADADEKMVDLPSTGASIDVEIDDKETIINKEDGVEVVNESTEVVIEDKKETASEGEMEDYGKKVQSRIDKLTKKLKEENKPLFTLHKGCKQNKVSYKVKLNL